MNRKSIKSVELARLVLAEEAKAISLTARSLDSSFEKAVKKLSALKGKILVVGVGKSGIIGRKIASTLSSTGSPAFFIHPVEFLHGDMGTINRSDAALLLSHSGETDETNRIIPFLKNLRVPLIAITGNPRSRLAKKSNIVLEIKIRKEACPYNLVPTSSTAAMLALGDALAVSLMKLKGFTNRDFAGFHPAGNIGRLLTLKVGDIMRKGKDNPLIKKGRTLKEALFIMTKTRTGAVSIVDVKGRLAGYFTDGDLRRCFQKGRYDLREKIESYMTKNPTTAAPEMKAAEAARIIKERKIDNMPVIDPKTGKPVGILDERDLIEKGLL